jgi:hypothetical protein
MADVYRPKAEGKFPALVSASPYPRQIQNTTAPMGFVEAGASDFFVPRGYAHVIANLRGTNGSEGEFGLLDAGERRDIHDLVEWAAQQPWCDGNVGMVGISYFAQSQLLGAVEQPPHLRAIFPLAVSVSARDVAMHGGLFSKGFMFTFLRAVGVFGALSDAFLRGPFVKALSEILHVPRVHKQWEHHNGESALMLLEKVTKAHHPPHPWDDYAQAMLLHSYPDDFWTQRDVLSLLGRIRVPTYLGCDWENVSVHLPSTFIALRALPKDIPVRVAMMGPYGLTWPWESMHVEALAWFDHWLRGRETGIMEGPPIRYILPEAGDEWHASESWPPPQARPTAYALRADGVLSREEGTAGTRAYVYLPAEAEDASSKDAPVVQFLRWETPVLESDVDIAGEITLELDAAISSNDTAWFVTLEDVGEDGSRYEVTAGWRRAATDDEEQFQCVTPNQRHRYRIPLIDNARRFRKGHRIALLLRSDDRMGGPPNLGMHHLSVGGASRNTIFSSSRLTLPVL